ncbi:MAG: hypothetical protein KDB14_16435, partial [Planctomycetales bacterium]|nr:hypothetical protein [Planctomycetales bacterium]
SAFALVVLVFGLTFRLRRGEFQTLRRIGASARRLAAIVACECVAVIVASASLAAVLTWTATLFEPYLLRWLL